MMLLWAWLKYLRSDNRLYLKIAKRSNADEAVAILLALRGKENDKSADKDTETSTAGPPPQPAPPRRGVHRLWHWLRQRFRN
ncbi:MAG: hypothetical protein ABS81_07380 [Pseudonocardia sp. SCN 72-86]|nr:MAG: hypothetical protein ABS81_07380 [Pseudonocardia sp. SCN 72-86]